MAEPMESKSTVTLEAAIDVLPRRPALLLGPNATTPSGTVNHAIASAMQSILAMTAQPNAGEVARSPALIDELRLEDGARAARLESQIKNNLLALPTSPELRHLVTAGWSACVSVTQDLLFESAL
jgi:hypothetical protein